MDISAYLPFLTDTDLGNAGFIVLFVVGQVFTFLITRTKSKDTIQEKLMQQAMARQSELDKSQQDMMTSLQKEIQAIKDDAENYRNLLQNERERNKSILEEEREKYVTLSEKYSRLFKDNNDLQEDVLKMRSEAQELIASNEVLRSQNEGLFKKIEEMDLKLKAVTDE